MTQNDAIQKLESWLLVPVDYDTVIPALARIHDTADFSYYVKRVAETEYVTPQKVLDNVNQYLSTHPVQDDLEVLDKKLEQISGRSNRQIARELQPAQVDILDELDSRRQRKLNGASDSEKMNDAFQSFVSGYIAGKSSSLPVPTCRNCHTPLATREVSEMTTGAIILTIILFFFCLPLAILPILFGRQKKTQKYCPKCKRIHSA